jgi:hypothetical protein
MSRKKKSEFNPELYTEEQLDSIDQHIVQYFGDYKNVFHEIVSPDIHVDICIIEPDEENDYYTLVTMGMGAHKMNVPEKLAGQGLERAELVICLPPDWNLNSDDEKDYWPIRLLKDIARLPINSDTWIGWGHSVDNGEPFAENTELCGTIILSPPFGDDCAVCVMPDGEEVNFYQLIPIHQDEMDFKVDRGTDELLDAFEDNLSPVVDPEREPVIRRVNYNVVDRWEWHVGSIREKKIPIDEITGYNHMAIYLRWAIENDLMCETFNNTFSDIIKAVKSRENTDLREFIRDELDGVICREHFNDEGEEFAEFYYNHDNDEDEPCYPCDVDDHALKYFGEERYNSDEFYDEAYLFVPFDEDYYSAMKEYIEHYYAEFRNK